MLAAMGSSVCKEEVWVMGGPQHGKVCWGFAPLQSGPYAQFSVSLWELEDASLHTLFPH